MNIRRIDDSRDVHSALASLAFLKDDYPSFVSWSNAIMPHIIRDDDTRKMFVAKGAFGNVAGYLILKNTTYEKKICTLYVADEHRHNGIGKRLIDVALNELGTDKPLITVSSKHINEFRPLLDAYGFSLV